MCGVVGPRALVVLPRLVGNILSSLELQTQGGAVADAGPDPGTGSRNGGASVSVSASGSHGHARDDDGGVAKYMWTINISRARALLLRSCVASLTAIITDIPSFAHPYILDTLSVVLPLRCSAEESTALSLPSSFGTSLPTST